MTNDNSTYAFEPATFHSMRQAQELTDVLEENLITLRLCHPSVNPELLAVFLRTGEQRGRARHE